MSGGRTDDTGASLTVGRVRCLRLLCRDLAVAGTRFSWMVAKARCSLPPALVCARSRKVLRRPARTVSAAGRAIELDVEFNGCDAGRAASEWPGEPAMLPLQRLIKDSIGSGESTRRYARHGQGALQEATDGRRERARHIPAPCPPV